MNGNEEKKHGINEWRIRLDKLPGQAPARDDMLTREAERNGLMETSDVQGALVKRGQRDTQLACLEDTRASAWTDRRLTTLL